MTTMLQNKLTSSAGSRGGTANLQTGENHLGPKTCSDAFASAHPQLHEGFQAQLSQHNLMNLFS